MAARLTLLLCAVLGLQSAAIVPATAAQTSVPQSDEPKFALRAVPKEQRAPVVYESAAGAIAFKANIAGREVWAMLDTGATNSIMDIELARMANLAVGPQEKPVRTPRGELMMQRVSDVPILIPGQFETLYPGLAAVELGAVSKLAGRKIEFILGRDFLRSLVLLVDPGKRTFQLAPSGSFKAPPAAAMSLHHPTTPQIEVVIGSEKLVVSMDTGFNGQLNLTPAAWERIVPKGAATGTRFTTGADGKTHVKKTVLLPEIAIGSLRMTDVEVGESPVSGEGDGLVGMGLLGKFRFALDIKMGKLWVSALPPPDAAR
jgi:predicted aspartyl protease